MLLPKASSPTVSFEYMPFYFETIYTSLIPFLSTPYLKLHFFNANSSSKLGLVESMESTMEQPDTQGSYENAFQERDDKQPRLAQISEGYIDSTRHFINLNALSVFDQLFTTALGHMKQIRSDYAVYNNVNYKDAFNWAEVLTALRELAKERRYVLAETRKYHIIAYYSQLESTTGDSEESKALLCSLDKAAFEEALELGGLLKYWFGKPDGQLRNLATCIWRSKREANAVMLGPSHIRAKKEGFGMYRNIVIKELELTVEAGLTQLSVNWKRDIHVKNDLTKSWASMLQGWTCFL